MHHHHHHVTNQAIASMPSVHARTYSTHVMHIITEPKHVDARSKLNMHAAGMLLAQLSRVSIQKLSQHQDGDTSRPSAETMVVWFKQ
jgi:uncharacterized protein YbgA (DUF1722 family)